MKQRTPPTKPPSPETYSYYGPLNLLTYNVGLHNEHHDFPAIPWTRLSKLNRIAHEFYDGLPRHTSWVYVMWQFIWDKDVSLWSRVKRSEGGRLVGGKGGGWNEEELGANEKKGPIPGCEMKDFGHICVASQTSMVLSAFENI